MKKIFTLAAIMAFAINIYADDESIDYIVDGDEVTTVGETDCSTGWWAAFSSYYQIPSGYTLTLNFTNYTDGANNWDNYLVVVTNDYGRDDSDYSEYIVLRSDAYGWGNAYDSSNLVTDGFDWDTFTSDIAGATVEVTVTNDGSTANITSVATSADENTVMTESIDFDVDDDTTIRAFLTVEAGYLDGITSSIAANSSDDSETGISSVVVEEEEGDGTIYNLSGQEVDSSYKGLVIKNGKKYISK